MNTDPMTLAVLLVRRLPPGGQNPSEQNQEGRVQPMKDLKSRAVTIGVGD